MITILKGSNGALETAPESVKGCWVKVSAPTPDEVERLQSDYHLPLEFITYALDMDERARVEKEDGVTLILLRLPHFQGHDHDVPYTTVPVGVLLTDQVMATICPVDSHVLRALAQGVTKGLSTSKTNRFLLHLLRLMADRYLTYLREIDRAVEALEDKLQRSLRNEEVLALLKYQKSLTYFTTGLKSNSFVLGRLEQSGLFAKYPDDAELLGDVVIEVQQAIEMTDISANILSQMMDAFASIISNNLNVVMKFLASMTIVLTIPTLIASVYGMNIPLPFEDHPLALVIVMGVAVAISVTVGVVFWKKDWF